MAINERLIDTEVAAGNGGAGNAGEEGLILHLDANDVDSYDGDGSVWYDIKDHEYTPATNVDEHFNTVTYTGNGTSNSADCGFQPDLIWVKNRDATNNHIIVDSLRGATNYLIPNLTDTAGTTSSYIDSITSTGFTFDGTNGTVNKLNNNYVAWCFKAGGAAVSNTNGDITSQVSVNNDLGFSIVSYTGNSSFGQTVGHGLDVQPQMVIHKNLSNARNWRTYVEPLGATKYINLDETAAAGTYGSFNNTAPTSTVFSTTNSVADRATNFNGDNYIAYCFTSKRGVSKVGSYTGNGSTTGPIVYLGFEPAFLMFKCSSQVGNWIVIDNKRATSNPRTPHLRANSNSADDSGTNEYVDFLGNGFQPKGVSNYNNNSSGQTYIYYAVAKNTKETSLIPDTDLELHLDAASFPQFGESGYSNTPSTWTDSSGNGNNGTISGATFDSELGNWLDFEGVNDKVTTSYDIPSAGAKTIEFWFNDNGSAGTESTFPSPIGGSNAAIWTGGNLTGSFSDESLGFFNADTGLHFYIRTGTNTYRDNNWHHVAITDNGSNQHAVYVDGESHSISYLSGSSTSRISINNVQIGKGKSTPTTGTYSYWFNGQVGQVRIYSSALTQDQVRQNYNFTKNNYPNGYDGTITALDFDANGYFTYNSTSDKVVITNATTKNLVPSINTDKTYLIWARINNTSSYNAILTARVEGSTQNFYLRHNANVYNLAIYDDGGTRDINQNFGSLSANTWYLLGFRTTTDGNARVHSITNGSSTFTDATGTMSSYEKTNVSLNIGYNTSGFGFNGNIGKVKVYDRYLSDNEITEYFNETKADFGL